MELNGILNGFKLILMGFYKQHLEILGNKHPVVRILFISLGNINGILCYIILSICILSAVWWLGT